MTWHYEARRKRFSWGEDVWGVVEVYTSPDAETEDFVTPMGDSLEELIADLERMLKDIRK